MSIFKTSRRRFVSSGAGLLGAAAMGAPFGVAAASSRRPDILFILADDMGMADLSCYGQTAYRTPVLDRLAASGLRAEQGYASSAVCSATRTALATGRYQQRFPIGLEEPAGPKLKLALPPGTPTLGSRFKQLGYRTALLGKWHLGDPATAGPTAYGYDYFWGISGGSADYFRHGGNEDGPSARGLFENNRPTEAKGYLTDLLAERSIDWIRGGGDTPFFLSLHFNAPHWPWEGPDDEAHAMALNDLRDDAGGSLETYGKMVRAMDSAIGRVLAAVRKVRPGRELIVVFTSDNGGERYSYTWPLTGTKGELLEGGIRVPLIVSWPGHIRPGTVSHQVMTTMDFTPTLLATAGGVPPGPAGTDGMNLLPHWLGQTAEVPRQLFWRFKANEQSAARIGDWKYLKLGGKEHLFHIPSDPRERAEKAREHPEIFERLKQAYREWDSQMLPYLPSTSSEDVKKYYPDRY